MEPNTQHTLTRLAMGGLAGLVGVWALDRVTWWMLRRQDRSSLRRERAARPMGLDPAHVLSHRAASAFGLARRPRQPTPGGLAVHYAIGILPAAGYALLRDRGFGRGRGTLFGLGLFAAQDELANWALGLSGPPQAYPWQAHARGLVGHAVYGFVTDATLRGLERLRSEQPALSAQAGEYPGQTVGEPTIQT